MLCKMTLNFMKIEHSGDIFYSSCEYFNFYFYDLYKASREIFMCCFSQLFVNIFILNTNNSESNKKRDEFTETVSIYGNMLRNFISLCFNYNFYKHECYLHRFDKSSVDCRPSNGRSVICAVKFWLWIRWSRGRERKTEKKGVLKYSYGLPCDVDRGSTSMDNTAVDSIFEFKEPARGLG